MIATLKENTQCIDRKNDGEHPSDMIECDKPRSKRCQKHKDDAAGNRQNNYEKKGLPNTLPKPIDRTRCRCPTDMRKGGLRQCNTDDSHNHRLEVACIGIDGDCTTGKPGCKLIKKQKFQLQCAKCNHAWKHQPAHVCYVSMPEMQTNPYP